MTNDEALIEECKVFLCTLEGHIGCTATRYGTAEEAQRARMRDAEKLMDFAKGQRAAGVREVSDRLHEKDGVVDIDYWCESRATELEA